MNHVPEHKIIQAYVDQVVTAIRRVWDDAQENDICLGCLSHAIAIEGIRPFVFNVCADHPPADDEVLPPQQAHALRLEEIERQVIEALDLPETITEVTAHLDGSEPQLERLSDPPAKQEHGFKRFEVIQGGLARDA